MSTLDLLLYLGLGGMIAIAFAFVYTCHTRKKLGWKPWVFINIAIVLVALSIAWAYASVVEKEFQACWMGLLAFGGPGVVFGFLAWRRMSIPAREENEKKREKGPIDGTTMAPRKVIAVVLLAMFALAQPVALLVREVGNVVFRPEKASELVIDSVISDRSLPKAIKKAAVYQVQHGMEGAVMENRLILGMLGSVDEREWIELFDLVLPEKTRIKLVEEAGGAAADWLNNDRPYPELVIPIRQYIAGIEANSEEVVSWMFDSMLFPACTSEQVAHYEKGIFGDDLKSLISCVPPKRVRNDIVSHAAGLLKSTIRSANPPELVNLADQIKTKISPEQIRAQKSKINKLGSVASFAWLLPILLLLVALALVVRSKDDLVVWTRWPLFILGILGTLLSIRFIYPSSVLEQALSRPPADVPPPALAVVNNLLTSLFQQTGLGLLHQMIPPLLIGAVLLCLSFRNTLKLPMNKLILTKAGAGVVSMLVLFSGIVSAHAEQTHALLVSPAEGIVSNQFYVPGTEKIAAEKMRIVVLGSGVLPASMNQAAVCFLVELGNGDKFLFDVGSQCHSRIAAQKIPYDYIDKVFLSRLHVDNFGDLPSFWLGGMVMNRLTPLRIWGPSGATEELGTKYIMDQMYNMYEWDRETRSGVVDARGMVLEITEFDHRAANQVIYDDNNVVIRSFPCAEGIAGSVGYILEWNGMKFAYAGSTKAGQAWIDYAKGADVAIHESWLPTKEGIPVQYHASPEVFGVVMAQVQPRIAVGFHFQNNPAQAQTVRQGIIQRYNGSLALASDYLTFNISQDNLQVREGKADREVWPTPAVKEKVAEPDKIKLIRLLTGYSQAGVLPMPEVVIPIYNELNETHGTDYSPIVCSLLVRAVKKLRTLWRAITGNDPSKQ